MTKLKRGIKQQIATNEAVIDGRRVWAWRCRAPRADCMFASFAIMIGENDTLDKDDGKTICAILEQQPFDCSGCVAQIIDRLNDRFKNIRFYVRPEDNKLDCEELHVPVQTERDRAG